MRKVQPLREDCETIETLLALLAEMRGASGSGRLVGLAGVAISEGGTLVPFSVGVPRGDLALAGAALTKISVGELT